jgi:hypothetical protein
MDSPFVLCPWAGYQASSYVAARAPFLTSLRIRCVELGIREYNVDRLGVHTVRCPKNMSDESHMRNTYVRGKIQGRKAIHPWKFSI